MAAPTLTADAFAAFFKAIWGYPPFPWQERLLRRLATGEDAHHAYKGAAGLWPDVLDLPTGAGKTAAIDIAVFHLALDAATQEMRRAPVRIAFVVDRRLIVDDAFSRAERLADALRWSLISDTEAKEERGAQAPESDRAAAIDRVRAEPVVRQVALRLCALAGSGQPPLVARAMRGGAPLEDDWARTPVQPTILCSTVDQVGSRLLFRGYGISDSMKPIHAGLLGSDCLLLLDEAHLAEPFRQTLDAIQRLRAPRKDIAPFGFSVLTATPKSEEGAAERESPFALSAADEADLILARRTNAAKPARLEEIPGRQGVDAEIVRSERTAEVARKLLADLQRDLEPRHPAIGVVMNRVARARAVFDLLREQLKDIAKVILLIGPARGVDRDKQAKRLEPIRTGNSKARDAMPMPLVVVATQTIEAGVDIDFDGLVTEAAAFDALRQRFGRLNRAGRDIAARAVILAHKEDIGAKADDPVYGDRISTTWSALNEIAGESKSVDFGIAALKARVSPDQAAALAAPSLDAPVLMPAYADLWSHTSPIPNADPEVSLFLHGPNRSPASVQIVWRADISKEGLAAAGAGTQAERDASRAGLIELLGYLPPRGAEAIEVPIWAARFFLTKNADRIRATDKYLSDVAEVEPEATDIGHGRPAFRWAGAESERTKVVHPRDLRSGDLIVVPVEYGGCDEWGWNPRSSAPVIDVAEAAAWPYRGKRFAVRVTPGLIAQSIKQARELAGEPGGVVALDPIAEGLKELLTGWEDISHLTLLGEIQDWCSKKISTLDAEAPSTAVDSPSMLLPDLLQSLHDPGDKRRRPVRAESPYQAGDEESLGGVVFVAPRGLESGSADALIFSAPPSTEEEEIGAASESPVLLVDHCSHVSEWAAAFADAAGLSPSFAADLRLAASLHDLGKADPRYQTWYAGGNPYGEHAENVLAKSGQRRLPRGAWERARLPPHWRHEALSVRLAQVDRRFKTAQDPELVLWLIGTHHGHGRPFFPHKDDLDRDTRPYLLEAFGEQCDLPGGYGPQSLAFDFEGIDWATLFERLKERYGIWGLARLEAFIRLADHRASDAGRPPYASEPFAEAAE